MPDIRQVPGAFKGTFVIDRAATLKRPEDAGALNSAGGLRVLPASFWADFTHPEVAAFCVRSGFYFVPTTEFVSWLAQLIGTPENALEIGAGSGVLAEALGVRAVDSHMQEWPHIAAIYKASEQATVPYGANVERLDAAVAVERYRPRVVLAAWVTHKFNPKRPELGGNMYGVNERSILRHAPTYVHIGHTGVHALKPISALGHRAYKPAGMISRAMSEGENLVQVWGDSLPGE